MKAILILLTLVFIVGCTTERIVYVNQTVEINNTVIKEVEVVREVIKEVQVGTDCPTIRRNSEYLEDKLTLCNIMTDVTNDELHQCLIRNTTRFADNISNELSTCKAVRLDYKHILNNISALTNKIE